MKSVRKFIAYPFVVVGVIILAIGLLIGVGFDRSAEALTAMTNSIKALTKGAK